MKLIGNNVSTRLISFTVATAAKEGPWDEVNVVTVDGN